MTVKPLSLPNTGQITVLLALNAPLDIIRAYNIGCYEMKIPTNQVFLNMLY
jgi:hypothetical protein